MPAPLSIDWDQLKSLYLKGLSLPDIARETGVGYGCLRTHAHRYAWKSDASEAGAAVKRAVTGSLIERGQEWGGRIATVLENHVAYIEKLDPADLDLDQIEQLVRIIKSLDDVGRRTFRLDEAANGDGPWGGRVIDVVDVRALARRPTLAQGPTEAANAAGGSLPG
jgi:hypothetical protein